MTIRADPTSFLLYECPHLLFAHSVMTDIIDDWEFEPGTRDGEPVAVRATVEVLFKLR